MAARSASPTSLLWAHQLKREHGLLLKRMQEVEATNERQAKRIKTVENTAADTDADLTALVEKVQALEDRGLEKRLSDLENDTKGKVDDLKASSKALATQMAAVQQDDEAREQRKTLLGRIGELEKGLETYEQSLQQLGRRVNQVELGSVKTQLEGLSKQVTAEGEQMKMLFESVTALASANEELKLSNERLAAELGEITSTNAAAALFNTVSGPNSSEATKRNPLRRAPLPLSKKKSHKWSGGGADRDIIVSGLSSSPVVPTSRGQRGSEVPSHGREAPVPAKLGSTPKQNKTSKVIPQHLHAEDSVHATEAMTSRTSTGPSAAEKELISSRARRVIIQPPPGSEDLIGANRQQPPPQPRKRIETPRWSAEEAWTQGRTTRRGGHAQHAIAKNEPDAESKQIPLSSVPTMDIARKKAATKKATLETSLSHKCRPDKDVFSLSSSVIAGQQPEAPVAPVLKRRRVPQDD